MCKRLRGKAGGVYKDVLVDCTSGSHPFFFFFWVCVCGESGDIYLLLSDPGESIQPGLPFFFLST